MEQLEDPRQRLVREWLALAQEELSVARTLFAAETKHVGALCFHCQQAAEKFLKALLTDRQIEFTKTHDLDALLVW